jgi:hypothetical protein
MTYKNHHEAFADSGFCSVVFGGSDHGITSLT